MRKRTVLLLSIMSIMSVMLMFTGCGKDKIIGTWTADAFEFDGEYFELSDLNADGEEIGLTLTVMEDGTFTCTAMIGYESSDMEGTWEKADNGEYIINSDNESYTISFEGDRLLLSDDTDIYYFHKN